MVQIKNRKDFEICVRGVVLPPEGVTNFDDIGVKELKSNQELSNLLSNKWIEVVIPKVD